MKKWNYLNLRSAGLIYFFALSFNASAANSTTIPTVNVYNISEQEVEIWEDTPTTATISYSQSKTISFPRQVMPLPGDDAGAFNKIPKQNVKIFLKRDAQVYSAAFTNNMDECWITRYPLPDGSLGRYSFDNANQVIANKSVIFTK